ncbi:MAG TPA: hypothetical protein P5186_16695 [Candidatus Paceibacterota bacterium]|nr:hypothetical protein [Candidatus Paceibacterota bacterium]
MTPQPELASTRYCLAKPGYEYLVYQPKAGEPFSVELKAATYQSRWFDVAKGVVAGSGRVKSAGGRHEFRVPFAAEAVLYLKRP